MRWGPRVVLGEVRRVKLPPEPGAGASFFRILAEGAGSSGHWTKRWEGDQSPR